MLADRKLVAQQQCDEFRHCLTGLHSVRCCFSRQDCSSQNQAIARTHVNEWIIASEMYMQLTIHLCQRVLSVYSGETRLFLYIKLTNYVLGASCPFKAVLSPLCVLLLN